MAASDQIGLLLKIRSDSKDAQSDIKTLRSTFEKEVKSIEGAGKNAFLSLGQSAGFSASSMAKIATIAPIVAGAVVAVGGAAIGAGVALFELTRRTAEAGSEIYDLSIRTGLSAEAVSSLKFAVEQTDASMGDLAGGITRFKKTIIDANQGVDEAIAKLNRLGIDPVEAAKDLEGALAKAFKVIYEAPEGIQQTSAATDAFSKSGDRLIGVVNQAEGDLRKLMATAREMGVQFSQADADAADAFGDQLTVLKFQFQGLAYEVGRKSMPEILRAMRDLSVYVRENRTTWKEWAENISAAVSVARGVLTAFGLYLKYSPASPLFLPHKIYAGYRYFNPVEASPGVATPATDSWDMTQPTPYPYADSGKSGKGGKDKDDARQEQLRRLERQIDAAERIYKKEIEQAQSAYELMGSNLEAHTEAMIDAENKRFTEKERIINQELGLAKKQADIDKANDALRDARDERDDEIAKIKREAAQKEIDSLREHQNNLLTLMDNFNQRRIESVRRLAELGKTTYEDAEQRVLEYQTEVFNERLKILAAEERELFERVGVVYDANGQMIESEENRINAAKVNLQEYRKINDEQTRITQQQVAVQEQADRDIEAGRQKDLDKERRYREQLFNLRKEYEQRERDLERERLENKSRLRGFDTPDSIGARLNLDAQDLQAHYQAIDAELAADQAAALEKARIEGQSQEQLYALDQQYVALRLQAYQVFYEKLKELKQQADIDAQNSQGAGLFGGIAQAIGLGTEAQEKSITAAEAMAAAWTKAGVQIGQAARGMAQGFGGLINQWVLYGNVGPNALRKLTASVLANLAAQATVEAVMELARAFAALARYDFHSASNHFTSAAIFGGVAGVSAIAGRIIAGDSFKQAKETPGAGSNAASTPTADTQRQVQTIVEDRGNFDRGRLSAPQPPQVSVHIIRHEIVLKDGLIDEQVKRSSAIEEHILSTVIQNYRLNRTDITDTFEHASNRFG